MDERAKIPVTLPRDNPTQSYWQTLPDSIAWLRSTEALPETADVLIIGSGITGAAVAWNLLKDGPVDRHVVMLEARSACSGATGRNGGHTKAASYRSFLDNAAELGTEAAVQIAKLEYANIQAVHAFAREHGIDCDSSPCDTIDVILDEGQMERARRAVKALQDALPRGDPAAEYAFRTADEVDGDYFCSPAPAGAQGGVVYPAGRISAYRFAIGVLKLCLQRGLNLQTNTPALELKRTSTGDAWSVLTARGVVTARQVVVATNGYTARIVPEFQGVIVPLRGQITAQRPGRKLPGEGRLQTTYSFIYSDGYEYMVPHWQQEGGLGQDAAAIVIGGGLARAADGGLEEYGTTDDTTLNKTISDYLYNTTAQHFGPWWGADQEEGRIIQEWTGIMGYSPDGFPFVGELKLPGKYELAEGLWMSSSFQGHGMVLCWMCARALVEMMEGRDNPDLKSWFPDAFRVSVERMAKRFEGRLHVSAAVSDEEDRVHPDRASDESDAFTEVRSFSSDFEIV